MTATERFDFLGFLRRSFSLRPGPGSAWPLLWADLRSILLSKRTPFLLAFLLIPLVVTIFVSNVLDTYSTQSSDVSTTTGARAWFEDMHSQVFFPLLIPIVTAVYATRAIGEEVEGKTLPYLFTRPVYRNWILIAKSLSFLAAATLLGIVAITLSFFVTVAITENPFDHLGELFGYWTAVGLTVLATGGVFLLVGVAYRRAMVAIVFYVFLWETILTTTIPANVQKLSFAFYERAYINSFIGRESGFLQEFLIGTPDPGSAVVTLLVLGIVGFLGSLLLVSYRDYNV